jgi:MFS family permease
LADVYGRRLIFVWGSVFFTTTSIIPPFIPNEIGFDVMRGFQGLAAAAMAPTALGILGNTFPLLLAASELARLSVVYLEIFS